MLIPTDTCSYSFLTSIVSLTVERIPIIVVAAVVLLTMILVALLTCVVCFYCWRRKKRELKFKEVYNIMNKISSD